MNQGCDRLKIARTFGAASHSYDVSARLQRYSGKHLMAWLPQKEALTVLDLGSGTGFFTNILSSKYQQVIGLDISTKMLQYAKENRDQRIHWIEGDAFTLPFADNSIDLIYSNLVIQWFNPLEKAFAEIMRVLKPGGQFIFSTLSDGTLFELKSSWAQVDDDSHVNDFKSLNDLHDAIDSCPATLINHTSKDIILEYESVMHLAHELKGLGANRVNDQQQKGLAGKDKWKKMMQSYQDFQEPSGIYPATYKVFSAQLVKQFS